MQQNERAELADLTAGFVAAGDDAVRAGGHRDKGLIEVGDLHQNSAVFDNVGNRPWRIPAQHHGVHCGQCSVCKNYFETDVTAGGDPDAEGTGHRFRCHRKGIASDRGSATKIENAEATGPTDGRDQGGVRLAARTDPEREQPASHIQGHRFQCHRASIGRAGVMSPSTNRVGAYGGQGIAFPTPAT
ncbi:hypothetical protein [Fodinicola feengrottensis]|uniref:Uncharacterized protein n=1 Tax=Fodinicola feengrottensis TaxID=435914 RepID=A0ABP4UW48_9ACTN|nr:hypothetical protein [Fodinicola feengrottensis]